MELDISNKKYVLLSTYQPPNQSINFFLNKLSEALDIFSKHYQNIYIFSDFNATPENNDMINFMNNQSLSNLIKGPTYFESATDSMIDLFLTTNKYLFQKTNSSKTGISDHHHLIATALKGALAGLRQFLATENPLKMMKNTFYFTSKALFILKIFKFLS